MEHKTTMEELVDELKNDDLAYREIMEIPYERSIVKNLMKIFILCVICWWFL